MKKDLHPQYYPDAKIICACGTTFTVGSTKPEIKVEICSNCHPFYTGKSKLIDTTGRVDRFKKVSEKSAAIAANRVEKKPRKSSTEKQAAKKAAAK